MTARQRPFLRVGYTPLLDSVSLAVAQEMGFFADQGIEVRLEQVTSWATARDLLAVGALDAAHMLAPVPVASALSGEGGIIAPMALSLNGISIVVSKPLHAAMSDVDPLAASDPLAAAKAIGVVIRKRRESGGIPLRFAAVFNESNHRADLRRWLKAGGVDPEIDTRLAIVPPGEVERCLDRGLIDGFCVGDPYGLLAVKRGVGKMVASSYELWSNRIEKVLAAHSAFATSRPKDLQALMRAVIGASQWVDQPANRAAAASVLVEAGYISAPLEVVRAGLTGVTGRTLREGAVEEPDLLVLHRYAANFPWISQARLFARDLIEVGAAKAQSIDPQLGFRPQLYRTAASDMGVAAPLADEKEEGPVATPWSTPATIAPIPMGAQRRFSD